MLIVCPSCASRYSIDDDKIGAAGRKVRCAGCRSDFFVTRADDTAESPVAPPVAVNVPADVASEKPPGGQAEAPSTMMDVAIGTEPDAPTLDEHEASSKDGTEAEMQAGPVEAGGDDSEKPDIDQAAMDALFEAELAAARSEAEAIAGPTVDAAVAKPPKGWRKLLPSWLAKPARPSSEPIRTEAVIPDTLPPAKAARKTSRVTKPARSARPRLSARVSGPLALGIAGSALLAAAVVQRHNVVAHVPATATVFRALGLPVNIKGLEFANVRSVTQSEGDARFLVVEGGVRSVVAQTVNVPLIEIRLRGEDGRTIYTWTAEPPRRSLKPGEALHFRTRLATPPEAGRKVEVRFSDRIRSASAAP